MDKLKRQAGYTLIELMIVVAVIGILAGIAYPSYKEYVMKGRRADAKAGLMNLQLAQEKYRANCPEYAAGMGSSCDKGTPLDPTDDYALNSSTTSPDGHYAMNIVAADATSYTLQATRINTGLQNGDKCGDFRIDEAGVKTVVNASAGYDAARCW